MPAEIDKLLRAQLPYSWMSSITALLKQVSGASPNTAWAEDKFALMVWRILHQELRSRRPGKLSAPGGALMAGPPGNILGPAPWPGFGNTVFARNPYGTGHCFRCGAYGHWARNCPHAQQAGQVINTPYVDWMATGHQVWDMLGPPPGPCRRCGQWHWGTQPCPAPPVATHQSDGSTPAATPLSAAANTDSAVAAARFIVAQAGAIP